jgi:hypothetical protein
MDTTRIKQLVPRIVGLLFALSFCGLAWGAPPHAQSHAKTQTQSDKAQKPKVSKTQHKARQDNQPVKNLGKMTVHGKLNRICMLEWLKLALKRPYTMDPAKADLTFCRVVSLTGSHIKDRLLCETSNQVFHRQQNCPGGLASPDCALYMNEASLDAALLKVDVGKLKAALQTVPDHFSSSCGG